MGEQSCVHLNRNQRFQVARPPKCASSIRWDELEGNRCLRRSVRRACFRTRPRTGLSEYGFRYYIPVTGRWASRDPLGEDGGVNRYCLLGNEALNWIDSLGLAPMVWTGSGIESFNWNYGKNDHFVPYMSEELQGISAYDTRGSPCENTDDPKENYEKPPWPTFRGGNLNFVSRAGWKLPYWLPWEKGKNIVPFAEHVLDEEARQLSKRVKKGEFCEGPRKKIKVLLIAPKTDTLPLKPEGSCCDIEFVVYWSPKDTCPNQGPINDAFSSRESQRYWESWGGNRTYQVTTKWPGSEHRLKGFIDSDRDTLLDANGNPDKDASGGIKTAPHPVEDYLRPWYRQRDGKVDHIFVGHSQGANILMHVINRACCNEKD